MIETMEQLVFDINRFYPANFDDYYLARDCQAIDILTACLHAEADPVVFLFGRAGVGLSHLLQASCDAMQRRRQSALYLPAASLLQQGCDLLEGLEHLSLFCLDDVELVVGNAVFEQALFHFYNRMRDQGHRMIFAAHQPLASLSFCYPDLQTRLAWGVQYEVKPLEDHDKVRFIQNYAASHAFTISQDVAVYMVNHLSRDMARLKGLIIQLGQASLKAQHRVSIPFLKAYLAREACD
jgi:DnaA family protein